MGRREDKKEQKRERIVDAAAVLFARQGFEATSTRQIAKRARIASGTLFLYAPTKADVVMLVFEDRIGRALAAALASLPAAAALTEQLLHLYGAFLDEYERDAALARVFVKELLWLEGASASKRRALEGQLMTTIIELVEGHKARGHVGGHVDAWLVFTSSFSLYFTALSAWLGGELPTAADARSLLSRSLELLGQGLSPRGGVT